MITLVFRQKYRFEGTHHLPNFTLVVFVYTLYFNFAVTLWRAKPHDNNINSTDNSRKVYPIQIVSIGRICLIGNSMND